MHTPNLDNKDCPDRSAGVAPAAGAADHDRWFHAKARAALAGLADGTNRVMSDQEVNARRSALRASVFALRTETGA